MRCCACGIEAHQGDYGLLPVEEAWDRWTTAGERRWVYWLCPLADCRAKVMTAIMEHRIEQYLSGAGVVPLADKKYYSGVCLCGHSWESHHLGMVMNEEYFTLTGEATVPQECEYYGCNETGGQDASGNLHCNWYADRYNPDSAVQLKWVAEHGRAV